MIPVSGDADPEPDEDFQVNLRNAARPDRRRARHRHDRERRPRRRLREPEPGRRRVLCHRGGPRRRVRARGDGPARARGPAGRRRHPRAGGAGRPQPRRASRPRRRALGPWNVVVSNPAGRGSETLADAFTVERSRAERLDADRRRRRRATDQPYTAMLAYGNTGNVDATGVMIQLSGDAELRPYRPARFRSPRVGLRGPRRRTRCQDLQPPRAARHLLRRRFSRASREPNERPSAAESSRAIQPGGRADPGPGHAVTIDVDQATDPATTSPATLRGTYQVSGAGGGDDRVPTTRPRTPRRTPSRSSIAPRRPPASSLPLPGTVELAGADQGRSTPCSKGPTSAFEAAAAGGATSARRPASGRGSRGPPWR